MIFANVVVAATCSDKRGDECGRGYEPCTRSQCGSVFTSIHDFDLRSAPSSRTRVHSSGVKSLHKSAARPGRGFASPESLTPRQLVPQKHSASSSRRSADATPDAALFNTRVVFAPP